MRFPIFMWLVLIAIYSSLFGEHVISASGQCLNDLLHLKSSLVFSASLSTKLSKWNQSSSSWEGVTCEEGRVTGLDLSNESISGGINGSSSLFSLQYLKSLNLAFNIFNYSQIPSQIGNLSSLENLNLSNAGFAGQVPIAISGLTKLVTLDLSLLYFPGINSLQLQDPNLKMLVRNMGELRELYLDGVKISAPGAEWCGALSSSLPKLQVLSMSNCYLSGPIDESLRSLQNLSVIRLSGNNLSTVVPDFLAEFSNLTSLRLNDAGLYGQFPERTFKVPTLQTLDLTNNKLLNGSLTEFPRGNSLQTLVLSYTGFSGTLPDSIGYLQNLSRVELVNCSFRGQIPSSMANLTKLVYLDLSENNFTGLIPALSSSKNLTQIIFSHNRFTGQISSTRWEYLQNLQNLDLQYNSLDGGIPPSLFELPLIQRMRLSNNRFSGELQINGSANFSMYQVDTLELSGNNFRGSLPRALLEFPKLKYVSLSFNKFNGSMDISAIQRVSSLSYLDLSHNNLHVNVDDSASEMGSFPQMGTLKLASCYLRKFPYFLKNQSKLINLDLSNNGIEGKIPEWIWHLKNLLYLNLSSNFLEGTETPASWNLPPSLFLLDLHDNNLQGPIPPVPQYAVYVDYSNNNLSSAIPEKIGENLSLMIFFSLSNNRLHGSIPKSVCGLGYLQVLDLSANDLTGSIPSCLVIDSLKILNLRNNSFTGGIPENFTVNCGLKTLDLSRNRLEGDLPQSLKNCTSLEVLDVGNNQIDGVFPCHLKNTTKLRVLVLRSNRFSGQIGCPMVGGSWSLLQIVDLANNDFTNLPPAECLSTWEAMQSNVDTNHLQYPFLGLSGLYYQDTVTVTIKGLELELVKILTIFTSIDFSANKIKGAIPSIMGNFTALRLLNLSNNAISGPIPSSLGNLQVLESLDLSKNHLNGAIPLQLTNLNFLSLLNLSSNELVGTIPVGKQFSTFSEYSYGGNPGLCGTPLKRVCGSDEQSADKPDPGFNNDVTEDEFDWQFILTGLGFGAGAAMVVAPLTLWKKGSKWCDDHIDRFLLAFLPMLGFTYTIMEDSKSEDGSKDDKNGFSDEDDSNGFDLDKEESWVRYCLFCTKLDPSMKRVLHDPKCTCYDSQDNSSAFSSSSYSSSTSTS